MILYLIKRSSILINLAFNLTDYLVQKSRQMKLRFSCGKLSAISLPPEEIQSYENSELFTRYKDYQLRGTISRLSGVAGAVLSRAYDFYRG